MRWIFFVSVLTSLCLSCTEEVGKAGPQILDAESIYFDYKVWGEEGKTDVTVFLQFREGDEEGRTLILESPASVVLDSTTLQVDSAKLTGVYYEHLEPVDSFVGQHTIVFTDARGEEYKEAFTFETFGFEQELEDEMPKQPFTIRLTNFPQKLTRIRLVMIDTAFATSDVNEVLRIKNGILQIDEEMLTNLSTGPIMLELFREENKSLESAGRQRGRLTLSYGLKREFSFTGGGRSE